MRLSTQRGPIRAFFSLLFFILWPFSLLEAHPVPRRTHDRTLIIRLTQDALVVEYRLEVDPFTVVYEDLPAFDDKVDLAQFTKPADFYEAYTRVYAPVLADSLKITLDGVPLPLRRTRCSHALSDEAGKPLDHLRCDFFFQAPWRLRTGARHVFEFKEANRDWEEGRIQLKLVAESPVAFESKTEPEPALQLLSTRDLKPGADARRRQASSVFSIDRRLAPSPEAMEAPKAGRSATRLTVPMGEPPPDVTTPATGAATHRLLDLLLDSRRGLWLLLLLSAGLGAVHALTPGHGKTLVAAYLVGAHGTVWHALVLGLVTTLTHTGAVILLAAGLVFFFPGALPEQLQSILGVVGGLLIAGLGFWLLLRRLAGAADYFHLPGQGYHQHPHSQHDGKHDHVHRQAQPLPLDTDRAGWAGLIVLGVSGGIIPCWDAIAMLGFAISAQRLWLALPLLLAFSAGLAAVLIVVGIGVVTLKGYSSSRWGESTIIRALPILSALLIMLLGFWLGYASL